MTSALLKGQILNVGLFNITIVILSKNNKYEVIIIIIKLNHNDAKRKKSLICHYLPWMTFNNKVSLSVLDINNLCPTQVKKHIKLMINRFNQRSLKHVLKQRT